ncbi:MAG: DNA polymerase III subunit delta [Caldilineaceae bacterium]|nr:DNA polymerase III subunit delta [Caldilineaceae bacterium]MBP8110103.1 DNA polymerase III subunit delta [Caldilineaceae bacterium]MBP8124192.1 DNA polymerase III subunit delta [Caldilineaceae bacterium]MBP9071334.1 DNA polymerase III subunit delta [Caldilineaceae bacterium]
MITLLLNPDEYMAAERMAEFKAALGDPEMADLNTAEIDGPRTSASDILGQASMMPFLAPMRLLIVSGYLSHLDKRMGQSKGTDNAAYAEATSALAGLPALPDTCHLIFLENAVDKRRHLWKGFKPDGGGAKVAGLADLVKAKTVALEELNTPDAGAVEGWLMRRAKQKKIAIEGQAIKMLSTFVGPNLRQLDNELEKLATYASGRAVSAGDVRLLVSDVSEALIWDMTDALSRRDGRKAMQALYELRKGDANAFYLLTMIARQYRVILQVKEAERSLGSNETAIGQKLGIHPFPVKKALGQSRSYSFEQLEDILEQMLEADYAMKTGADQETTIDLMVAGLTRRR